MNVKELFDYDRTTGNLLWKVSRSRTAKVGHVAGSSNGNGYMAIKVSGILYFAHRLVWLWHYGEFPDGQIDHINGIRNDNRIENLRDVTASVNQQNQRNARSNNKIGLLGVSYYKRDNNYVAQIQIDGKKKNLGNFHCPYEAHEAYLHAKRLIHAGCTI